MTAGVLAAHLRGAASVGGRHEERLRSCGRLIDQRPLSAPEVPSCGSFSPYPSPSSRAEACRLPPVYAGSPGTPSAANGNSHAVSQYDVACFGGHHDGQTRTGPLTRTRLLACQIDENWRTVEA